MEEYKQEKAAHEIQVDGKDRERYFYFEGVYTTREELKFNSTQLH